MKLNHGIHLAYCTNIHRGESWEETFAALRQYTLAVRDLVCPPGQPYGIGLRLSDLASRELSAPGVLAGFRRWLDRHHCYVFTVNGFPFGRFHGGPVKERAYLPDWTSPERLAYTNRLFDLLAQLLPQGVEGSVSTVPGAFKESLRHADELKAIRQNLWHCVEHAARTTELTARNMHLGLEMEPLCLLETIPETLHFFDRLRTEHPRDPRLEEHLGVTCDTCHLAVEFEDPAAALCALRHHRIKIGKIQLSNALRATPTPEVCETLQAFADDVYLHQVVCRDEYGGLTRFKDLPDALSVTQDTAGQPGSEWRIHFHIPLNCPEIELFGDTRDHLLAILDNLANDPTICSHLEMETYTWEVLPPELKDNNVVYQIAGEYQWCLEQLAARGLAPKPAV